jgi:uncharacterized protein
MIVDFHAHVASAKVIPPGFLHGWADNLGGQLELGPDGSEAAYDLLASTLDDEDCGQLVGEMDEAGISKAVLLIIDFGLTFPERDDGLDALHRLHQQIARTTERFEIFAGVDPRRGQSGADFLARALSEGCAGFKIYPPCGYSPSDRRLDPFYEICQAHRVPVLSHLGATSSSLSFAHAVPMEIDDAARRFPKLDFVLAHAGTMYHQEAGLLAQYRPNIHLDISGFQSELGHARFQRKLHHLLEAGLARKLLFGTDWPIHRLTGNQKSWVDQFLEIARALAIPEPDLELMLHRNAERLLARRFSA